MLDNFRNAPWGEWVQVLSTGNPPLALQFAVLNTIFFVIFAIRRLRGKRTSHDNASYAVHALLIFVNVGILYQKELLPYYTYQFVQFWQHFKQII
jgi:hypothetical protein